MSDHDCLHEGDIAIMKSDVAHIKESTDKILEAINGNGKIGLKTQAELNKASLRRLWVMVSGMSLVIVAGAIKVVLF